MQDNRSEDQDIEALLRAAGRRRNPPDEVRERVYAAALAAWEEQPRQARGEADSSYWRRYGAVSIAAAMVLTVALGFIAQRIESPSAEAARVVFVRGDYRLNDERVAHMATLTGQNRLMTGSGSLLTLQTPIGALVTLDENTELGLRNAQALDLIRGRVYVDIRADRQAGAFTVHSGPLSIVDVGTQFEVQVNGDESLTVLVRDGRVDVHGGASVYTARAQAGHGEALTLEGKKLIERAAVPAAAARWDWRKAGRAPYALHDSTVYDYLQWMAADTGHRLDFRSRAVEHMAKISRLQSQNSLNSDNTSIEEALAATRFVLQQPREGLWVVAFRNST